MAFDACERFDLKNLFRGCASPPPNGLLGDAEHGGKGAKPARHLQGLF